MKSKETDTGEENRGKERKRERERGRVRSGKLDGFVASSLTDESHPSHESRCAIPIVSRRKQPGNDATADSSRFIDSILAASPIRASSSACSRIARGQGARGIFVERVRNQLEFAG